MDCCVKISLKMIKINVNDPFCDKREFSEIIEALEMLKALLTIKRWGLMWLMAVEVVECRKSCSLNEF